MRDDPHERLPVRLRADRPELGFMLSSMIAVHIRRLNFVRAGGILPHMLHRQAREEDAAQAGNGR